MKISGYWLFIIGFSTFVLLSCLAFDRSIKIERIKKLETQLEVAKIEYATVFIEANKRGYIVFSAGLLVSNWVETPEEALERLSKRPRNDIDEEYHKTNPGK